MASILANHAATGNKPLVRDFTTKPPSVGTGLGLSTSRQIVDQHQGTLRVVEGRRATFRIELPLNGPAQVSVGTTKQRDSRTEQAVS
jgi:hypothetical protein